MASSDIREEVVVLCKVCSETSSTWVKIKILDRYDVQYYSCENCGFIQTETPYWLDEAYSSAIARSDIGLIFRNIRYSVFCSAIIPMICDIKLPAVDYGGGNGMFVRMMRDKGFEFYWQDKYAKNQFAEGFEASQDKKYSLLTAFEVFEHLTQPIEEIAEMFRYSDAIVFSTRLLPHWKVAPENWWFFTPDTGQHISLYSRESLEFIARKFNVRLSTNGISLHVLSKHYLPSSILKFLSYSPFAAVTSFILNGSRKSLLESDYYKITGRRLI